MPIIRESCYTLIRQRGYKSVAEKEFRTPGYWKKKFLLPIVHTRFGQLLWKMKNKIYQ